MNNNLLAALCSASFILTGCGGGSSSDNDDDGGNGSGGQQPVVKTGVFLDSAVENLSYKTASQNGSTDSQGKFSYVEGEDVTFSIGSLEFPVVKAGGVITPMTLAGTASVENQQVTNIAILLQSLDANGNPDDGITIPAEAATLASGAIDLTGPTEDFILNAAVINLVANSGSVNTTLVSKEDAQDHLQSTIESQLPHVRSWTNKTGSSESHLIFFSDNTFVYAENDDEEPNGLELGNYSYDTATGDITLTITFDNNGPGEDSGVGDIGTPVTIDTAFSNGNNTLKIMNGELEFTADDLDTDSIVGAWSITHQHESQHIILYSNNTFLYAENDMTEPNGLELGTYVYDAGTNQITYTITYDDNGPGQDAGIGDIGTLDPFIIQLTNDENTLRIEGETILEFSRSL
ncbi:MAG: hypothetical protein JKY50_18235 [Oleispira sp.]|nr:hypothetical protein [Oleispira sp.]